MHHQWFPDRASIEAGGASEAILMQVQALMRQWSLGIYADHIDRTRREESPRALSGCALRSRRSDGLGQPAPAPRKSETRQWEVDSRQSRVMG